MWRAVVLALATAAFAPLYVGAQTLPPGFAGSQTCKVCHEDIYNGLAKNAHHALAVDAKKGWVGRECEACHGPGQAHTEGPSADNIQNPAKLTPVAADKICLTCHLNQPTQVGRIESSHAKNQIACTACHKMHSSEPLVVRKADATNKLCASCHLSEWAQFQRPFHHKLPEGDMQCVDCHNPHGSIRPAMQQTFAANEPGCFKCHGDKRGPFTFEHAPLRFEGCQACHEPHGSANARMLTRADVRFVCLECHANLPTGSSSVPAKVAGVVPPAFHDFRSPVFQNCTVCHQKIHGSHVDRNLLK
ncbi:MAG: DmsE family decaheme c-type cytochrome [Bryobacteraceae bacterium]|jgi:DmsE family decaheme c-type cytochrome